MTFSERLSAFSRLHDSLGDLPEHQVNELLQRTSNNNPWFTESNVKHAINGILHMLNPSRLEKWTFSYDLSGEGLRKVAIVMAGNIPLVGFHDFLCVLLSGNVAVIKPSSKDNVLLPALINMLTTIEPRFAERIRFEHEQLKNFDAVIATGSDNTARHFEYYFSKYPHIIRRNRTSVAVLTGKESEQELQALGDDVFTYFGLGCRNVSKLFIPEGFNFPGLFERWTTHSAIIHHHKYLNNYEYQKSILLVNKEPHLDTGFLLLTNTTNLVSPLAVLFYEFYKDEADLKEKLGRTPEKIQCIVGNVPPATVPFGKTQSPDPWDYADNIDTMKFLAELV